MSIVSVKVLTGIRNRTIIEMLYLTGMRRAELIGLRNEDVDLVGWYSEGDRKKKQTKDYSYCYTFYKDGWKNI